MLQELAENRSRTYWFLGGLYLNNPDAGVLEELTTQLAAIDIRDDSEIAATVADLRQALETRNEERLQIEFARLFRGLREGYGPPPPYESLHREGRLVGDTTLAVARHYGEAGFGTIDPAAGPQDHLGVELKFMALLCLDESRAWAAEDERNGEHLWTRQAGFLDRHLLRWAPGYCRRIAEESREPFYAAAAVLTLGVIAADRELLACLRQRNGE